MFKAGMFNTLCNRGLQARATLKSETTLRPDSYKDLGVNGKGGGVTGSCCEVGKAFESGQGMDQQTRAGRSLAAVKSHTRGEAQHGESASVGDEAEREGGRRERAKAFFRVRGATRPLQDGSEGGSIMS